MAKTRVTCHEIAKMAGVSVGTVSRVINNCPGVSPARVERVQAAIAATNYQPSLAAGVLRRNCSHSIGIMLPAMTPYGSISYCTGSTLSGVIAALENTPYRLLASTTPQSNDLTAAGLREVQMLKRRSLDGLLLDLPHYAGDIHEALKDLDIPYVLVNPRSPSDRDAVMADDRGTAGAVVEYLLARGHRKIAYYGPDYRDPNSHYSQRDRFEAYCETMTQAGLEPREHTLRCPPGSTGQAVPQAKKEAVGRLLQTDCTAVVAYSSASACEVLQGAYALNVHVPEQLSLMCCDWDPTIDDSVIPVTCARVDHVLIGRIATQMLLKRLEQEGESLPTIKVSHSLMERVSVRELK